MPTLNEALNLPELAARIDAALAGDAYELLVVDDGSADGTRGVCAALSTQFRLRLIERIAPRDGLSGAVIEGLRQAQGRILLVMDADLQHPPESIPALILAVESGADFAIGSRYAPGGATHRRWSFFRKANSRFATALARPLAGKTADPMSGFFALPRAVFESAVALTPLGYKIALELICKCRAARIVEVPIHFGERAHGRSKLTAREQFRYLEHLSRLYDFAFPRFTPCAKFAVVSIMGWFCAWGGVILAWLCGMGFGAAVGLSWGAALLCTAVFHLRYVRTQREFLSTPHPWRDFAMIAAAEWSFAALAAFWLASNLAVPSPLMIFIPSCLVATATRYILRKELLQDARGLRRPATPFMKIAPAPAAPVIRKAA